jgi:thioredoxin 1
MRVRRLARTDPHRRATTAPTLDLARDPVLGWKAQAATVRGQSTITQSEEAAMAGKNVIELTDANFEAEVLKSDVPVLVDFTATWCGPCKVLAPIVEGMADEFAGKYKIGKLDIDDAPGVTQKYGVRGVPTVMVFKGGEKKAQHVGVTNKDTLVKLLES